MMDVPPRPRPPAAPPTILLLLPILPLLPAPSAAQEDAAGGEDAAASTVAASLAENRDRYAGVAREIWRLAEPGYQEVRSSALLQGLLADAGFRVEEGVAGIPTAFVAGWGSDGPVLAILAEFDALPGFSQDTVPHRQELEGAIRGHACGHHLFGTASAAAAVAVKRWLEVSGMAGTVRVYGTPAEEGGAGKVYMVRAGLFDDVDAVLHWHPGDRNRAAAMTSLANKSAKFRFRGVSAHAAAAPDRGRSALDGVEAMNDMVNLLREHVPEESRLHYVITRGGNAPNVVPDFAEVYYYVRHPDADVVQELFGRVVRAAEGAALGTDTETEYEVIHGIYNLLPNETLSRVADRNLRRVGGVVYSPREREFAEELRTTLGETDVGPGSQEEVRPFGVESLGGSTDVGDVSWVVPTAGITTATWVPGTAAHSWQAVAAGGMSIGMKGMMVAAETLAGTAVDLFREPEVIEEAWRELRERRGADFAYESLVGDRAPPLDYRN